MRVCLRRHVHVAGPPQPVWGDVGWFEETRPVGETLGGPGKAPLIIIRKGRPGGAPVGKVWPRLLPGSCQRGGERVKPFRRDARIGNESRRTSFPNSRLGTALPETPVSGSAKPEFRSRAFPNRSLGTRRNGESQERILPRSFFTLSFFPCI